MAFQNYKYFILFLGYAVLYCLYVALSTLKYFLRYWSSQSLDLQSSKFHILLLLLVSGMFCISATFLFGYHLYLVARNQTTLESFRAPIFRPNLVQDKRGFHLGTLNNMQEVFGDRTLLWFFPVRTYLGDGMVFPLRWSCLDNDGAMGCVNGNGLNTYVASSQCRGSRPLTNGIVHDKLRPNNHIHAGSIHLSMELE